MKSPRAFDMLRKLATVPTQRHWLIQGSGIAGDPGYVLWLVDHMRDPKTARAAGEAFSHYRSGLRTERSRTIRDQTASNPDPTTIRTIHTSTWIQTKDCRGPTRKRSSSGGRRTGSRFPKGTRYFMGAPVTREHCIDVLKNGYQRQRILAAHYSVPARARHAALQHQRAGVAATAAAGQDVVTRVAANTSSPHSPSLLRRRRSCAPRAAEDCRIRRRKPGC